MLLNFEGFEVKLEIRMLSTENWFNIELQIFNESSLNY